MAIENYYARNPHYAPDDFSDELEFIENCERNAGSYFADATRHQKAVYDAAMANLRGLQGPRYERAREAALATFRRTTTQARELCEETIRILIESGSSEVTEELSYRWDEIAVAGAMLEAAE